MVRYAIIVVLLVCVAVLADRVVREENQRYALMLNSCPATNETQKAVGLPDYKCLDGIQTRTAWAWHLYYGVTEPLPQVPWTSD